MGFHQDLQKVLVTLPDREPPVSLRSKVQQRRCMTSMLHLWPSAPKTRTSEGPWEALGIPNSAAKRVFTISFKAAHMGRAVSFVMSLIVMM